MFYISLLKKFYNIFLIKPKILKHNTLFVIFLIFLELYISDKHKKYIKIAGENAVDLVNTFCNLYCILN